MGHYKDCAHAIFDATWGEYKCKKKLHRLYSPKKCMDCKDHKSKQKVQKPGTDA